MSKLAATRLAALMCTVFALLAVPAVASAVNPQGTYAHWTSQGDSHWNTDETITIQSDNPNVGYFWAHQFDFTGGDGAYIGLQTQGSARQDNSRTKLAIFSIWNANAARGPFCGTFGGEGVGYSCNIKYAWTTGHPYRLRVWATGRDAGGQWWGAWVRDQATGAENYIGEIRVPGAWGSISGGSVSWTEYFPANAQAMARCSDLPYASAIFAPPTFDNGAVSTTTHSFSLAQNTGCENGKITRQSDNGARQEMGTSGSGIDAVTRDVAVGSNGTYVLDGYGRITRDGTVVQAPLWTWDIARKIALRSDGRSGYVLDGWGGVHPFGGAPAVSGFAYWRGWDIANDLVLLTDTSGYTLDGWGGIHPFGGAPEAAGAGYWQGRDIARAIVLLPNHKGGFQLDGWGGIHGFAIGNNPVPTAAGAGYWWGWDIARDITISPSGVGYQLDGWGGTHAFSINGQATHEASGGFYFAGHDVARALDFSIWGGAAARSDAEEAANER